MTLTILGVTGAMPWCQRHGDFYPVTPEKQKRRAVGGNPMF